jgi:hypothetical protein
MYNVRLLEIATMDPPTPYNEYMLIKVKRRKEKLV